MVEAITLDEYLVARGRPVVQFVKIDAEGAESLILEGMRETLHRDKPLVLLEVHDVPGSEENLSPSVLIAAGYQVHPIGSINTLSIDVHRYRGHLLATPG